MIKMIVTLFALGIIGGMFIPFQTSVNAKLSAYTKSTIYTSTISFAVGSIFLILLNAVYQPHLLSIQFLSKQSHDFYWYAGGMIGVTFLIGSMLLMPRGGGARTIGVTSCGQIIMGGISTVVGWFDAHLQAFTLGAVFSIILLPPPSSAMKYRTNKKKENTS